jgi:hypothetical protein
MDRIPTTSELLRYALEQLALGICTEGEIESFVWEGERLIGPALKVEPIKRGKRK